MEGAGQCPAAGALTHTCVCVVQRRTERCERRGKNLQLPHLKAAGAGFNRAKRLDFSFSRHSLAPERAETAFLWQKIR